MNNYERITKMSIDEMAHAFTYEIGFCDVCEWWNHNGMFCDWERSGKTEDECCEEAFKKWLMLEVQDSDRQ